MKKILQSFVLLAFSAAFAFAGTITITKQTYISSEVVPNAEITIGIEATAKNIRYQWQYRVDESTPWSNIRTVTSALTPNLEVTVSKDMSGYQFRCRVGSDASIVYSKPVILVVKSDLEIVSEIGSDLTIPSNRNMKVKITAIGKGYKTVQLEGRTVETDPLTYQWQMIKKKKIVNNKRNDTVPSDNDPDFVDIKGQTSRTIDFIKAPLDMGGEYNNFVRCVVVDGENKSLKKYTVPTKLTIAVINVKAQPQSQTTYFGDATTFSLVVSNGKAVVDSNYVFQNYTSEGWVDTKSIPKSTNGSFPCYWNVFPQQPFLARIALKYEAQVGVFDDAGNVVIDQNTGKQQTKTEILDFYSSQFYFDAIPTFEITSHSPSEITVSEGSSYTMSVAASSYNRKKLNYRWQYAELDAGTPVEDKDWKSFDESLRIKTNTAKLMLTSIKYIGKNKVCHYRCQVSETSTWGADDYIETSQFAMTVIERKPVFTKQPNSGGFFENNSAQLSVSTTGSNVEYVWQYYDDENIKWVTYEGQTTNVLTISNVDIDYQGRKIRCIASNGGGTVYSSTYKVSLKDPVSIKANPVDAEVVAGQSAKFSVIPAGSAPFTYQWQVKTSSSSWQDIAGATGKILTLTKIGKDIHNTQYRCKVSNGGRTVESGSANLSVNQPTQVQTPQTSVYIFDTATKNITVSVKGEPAISYEWFAKIPPSKEWVKVADGNLGTKFQSDITYAVDGSKIVKGTRYYCSVLSDNPKYPAKVKSKEISVLQSAPTSVVKDETKSKTSAFDGAEDTVKTSNASATFAVKAKGVGTVRYQWQASTDNGANWSDISKAVRNVYTTPRLSSENSPSDFSKKYRCVITTPAGDTQSEVFSVSKLDAVSADQIKKIADVMVYNKEVATFKVSTTYIGSNPLKYLWQVSKDNGKTWKNAGSVKDTFAIRSPSVSLSGNLYRCLVGNAGNGTNLVASNSALLTVKAAARITAQPKTVYTFQNQTAHFEAKATGYNLVYTWEISRDNGKTWSVLKAASSDNFVDYTSASIVKRELIRCKVYSKDDDGTIIGGEVKSSSAIFSANEQSAISDVVFSQSDVVKHNADNIGAIDTYFGFPAKLQVAATGYGIRYQWYKQNKSVWELVGTSAAFNVDTKKPTTATTLPLSVVYKCKVFNSTSTGGSEVWTKEIKISLDDPIAPANLTGQSASFTMSMPNGNTTWRAAFVGASDLRIVNESAQNKYFTTASYSYKRTAPTKATFNWKFTLSSYEDGKNTPTNTSYSYTGELTFTSSALPTGTVVDTKTKESGTIAIKSITSGTCVPSSLPLFEAVVCKGTFINHMNAVKLTGKSSFEIWKTNVGTWEGLKGSYTYSKASPNVATLKLVGKVDKMSVKIEYTMAFNADQLSGSFIAKETYAGKASDGSIAAKNNCAYSGTFAIGDKEADIIDKANTAALMSSSSSTMMLNSNSGELDLSDFEIGDIDLTIDSELMNFWVSSLGDSDNSSVKLEVISNSSYEISCDGASVGNSTIDCSSRESVNLTCSAPSGTISFVWLVSSDGVEFRSVDGANSASFEYKTSNLGGSAKYIKCMAITSDKAYLTDAVKLVP